MESLTAATNKWTFTQKIFFRFFFVYFVLYCFPFPFGGFGFTSYEGEPIAHFIDWLSDLTGQYFFGITMESLDDLPEILSWLIYITCLLLLSFLVTLIWTVLDRKRHNYEKLDQWFMLYLRFFLAFVMLSYGMHKIFPLQGGFITASTLEKPIGMLDPANLQWTFLAYSKAYKIFGGLSEMIGGLLILWRRTATLGTMILMGVLSVVVMLNFCFDIIVKFPSVHYLFIALIILWRDRWRLSNLFILNRPTAPEVYTPFMKSPKWSMLLSIFLTFLVICKLYQTINKNHSDWKRYSTYAQRPLYGMYTTEYFIREADTTLPLQSDSLRWKKITIDSRVSPLAFIHLSTDSVIRSQAHIDTIQKTIQFEIKKDTIKMTYSLPDLTHLFLVGKWKTDSIKVMMKKYDLNNYPLYRE